MKVSICCLTYNHGQYLDEAIESFLAQRTTFDVEIVVGDDASTDGTAERMQEYCQQFSNIRYHRHPSNIGMMPNAVYTLKQCTGDFIALCEGDDYWIDPQKLQKQVDFLTAHAGYAICFTGSFTRNEFNKKEEIQVPPRVVTIEELIKQNRFDTATALFHAQYLQPVPEWFTTLPFGDWATYLTVMHRSDKKAACLPDITAVRRLHGGGIYTTMYQSSEKMIKTLNWDIDFYRKMQTHLFGEEHRSLIEACVREKEGILAYLTDEKRNETALLNDILDCIPANGSFLLIDEWCLNIAGEAEGKTIIPFMEREGVYWGRPADDAEAIAEIERQRKNGVDLIVFTWQAFWWLEHYAGMYAYLKANYQWVLNNGGVIGFNLQKKQVAKQVALAAARD